MQQVYLCTCEYNTFTKLSILLTVPNRQELPLVVAAGSSHPPVDVAANDAAEVYLSQTVKRFAPLSPVDGSKDAWSLHSSSNSSLPQSVSVSRLGPTHSGIFTGRSSVTSWEIDDVSNLTVISQCFRLTGPCNYIHTYVRMNAMDKFA